MKKVLFTLLLSLIGATACSTEENVRDIEDFNFDWRFMLGDDPTFATMEYDDSAWRELHLPHDWSI